MPASRGESAGVKGVVGWAGGMDGLALAVRRQGSMRPGSIIRPLSHSLPL